MTPARHQVRVSLLRWALCLACLTCLDPGLMAADSGSDVSRTAAAAFAASITGEVIHANTLNIANFSLSDVTARPVLKNEVLTFTDCKASAYGGTVTGTVTVAFQTGHERCVIDLRVNGIDLVELISDFGGSAENYGGKISGQLALSFPMSHFEQAVGYGTMDLKEGSLVELPFFYSLLLGDIHSDRGRDTATTTFEIRDQQVRISNAMIIVPKGRLAIKGTIGLDGDLRLSVAPHYGSFLGLNLLPLVGGLFDSVFGSATSYGLRALVRGNIAKPQIILNPFGE